jgi:DnaJ family protein C protein 28
METHDWENYVERQIREAQEQGQFDNLPGKGKPFTHLDTDPLDQVLKSQGFTPRWLELDRQVREKIEIAEQSIRRTYQWAMQTRSSDSANRQFAEGEWREAQRVFAERLDEINQLIKVLNLELPPPVRHLQRIPLKMDEQLQRMGLPLQL